MFTDNHICIIGAGKVGTTLAQLFSRHGYQTSMPNRKLAAQQKSLSLADIVLLTVQDNAIEDLCNDLACHFKPRSIVAHCSGALSSEILAKAQTNGCFTASAHPLNTFPSKAAAQATFSNPKHATHAFLEGHPKALEALTALFQETGFVTNQLESQAKTAYHAACVFACNYLTALLETSLQTAEIAGLERKAFQQAIQPLLHSTLENIIQHGPSEALSGPLIRGDTDTISEHIQTLKNSNPELATLYQVLGRQTLALAESSSKLSPQKIQQLRKTLDA